MARRKQLEKIRERYQQTHGTTTGNDDSRVNGGRIDGSVSETPAFREPGIERYDAGYTGRVTSDIGGTDAGPGLDRKLYRGNGQPDRSPELGSGRAYQGDDPVDGIPSEQPPTAVTTGTGKRLRLPRLTPVVRKPDGQQADDGQDKKPKQQPLTARQAEGLREKLTLAYIHLFRGTDDIIRVTNGSHEFIPIWSAIDDSDISILVDARLRDAQRSARQATVVLRIIDMWEKAAEFMIIAPRVYQTYKVYSDYGFDIPSPRKARKRVKREPEQPAEYTNGYQQASHSNSH